MRSLTESEVSGASATRLVVGVDVGNSTTEACLAEVDARGVRYLGGGISRTSGIKGTTRNIQGVLEAIDGALARAGCSRSALALVLLNEATPVISGMAMETLTETVITESTMIGHDPATPGGSGLGVGETVPFHALAARTETAPVIVVIPRDVDYEDAAAGLEAARARGIDVRGAMVQRDDARLIGNRLGAPIPIVDEIALIDRVPLGMQAAVEVAPPGRTIRELSNPYGLATLFGLSAEETKLAAPIARALVGSRSAVVIRTPSGDITDRRIPAGTLELVGERTRQSIDVTEGAEAIMRLLRRVQPLQDAVGAPGTNVGGMLARVRDTMAELTGDPPEAVLIQDVLAVDTFVPREVRGGLAGEFALESAVALAAMVGTHHGAMARLADVLSQALGCEVRVGGVEADMALRGALTTPGTQRPVAVLDLGGGSTDAALVNGQGEVRTTHVSGAGDLVTRLIASELGLEDDETAENVKRYPLAKVESLFQLRLENGQVAFFEQPLPAETFARVVALKEQGVLAPVPCRHPLEKIRQVRRDAKKRVFVVNALRALERVAPGGNLRRLDFVVLLGGSSLDFEIPELIAEATAEFGIVCGTGNIRGTEGPRNAVATGLVAAHVERGREG
ncbi:diol dehydratase reactivase subunit alpha [Myxococcus sp. 1LA]